MQLRDTKDIHNLTSQLGLTLNESEIYVFLLRNGLTSGADIHVQMNMDKSSSYRAIKNLIEKNLIYKVGEERNQKFGANPESMLLSLFEKKKSELSESKKQLKSIFKSLDTYRGKEYKRKNITILEGVGGYKQFIESRILPGTKLVREIVTRSDIEKYFESPKAYDQYMKEYIAKRVSNKVDLRVLISKVDEKDHIDISSKKWLKEVRILPGKFAMNAMMTTWNDKTGFYSEEKGSVMCVVIKDRLIADLVNSVFDVIWEMSRVKKEE